MITIEQKKKITAAIERNRALYESDSKHAKVLGISTSVYSMVKQGQTDKALSDANWVRLARRLDVSLKHEMDWQTARTETFVTITQQMEMVQGSALSMILCDEPNIGKTYTARQYIKTHKEAIYIDCSQVKTKRRFIRQMATEFGLDGRGTYADVYNDLTYYIVNVLQSPLVILDEAGDLQYEAFLELKALWNATEHCCGWYMMGADGQKEKINRSIDCKKVGYTEILSRYGGKYAKISPDDGKDRQDFLMRQAVMVAKANAPKESSSLDIASIARRAQGSLRRVYTEIEKVKGDE